MKIVKSQKFRALGKRNLYVSGGQISKSFLVGHRHGQGNGSQKTQKNKKVSNE